MSDVSDVPVKEIKEPGKATERVVAKHVVMMLCSQFNNMSMKWVTKHLGYADHTAAIYAKRRVLKSLRSPGDHKTLALRSVYRECIRRIMEQTEEKAPS